MSSIAMQRQVLFVARPRVQGGAVVHAGLLAAASAEIESSCWPMGDCVCWTSICRRRRAVAGAVSRSAGQRIVAGRQHTPCHRIWWCRSLTLDRESCCGSDLLREVTCDGENHLSGLGSYGSSLWWMWNACATAPPPTHQRNNVWWSSEANSLLLSNCVSKRKWLLRPFWLGSRSCPMRGGANGSTYCRFCLCFLRFKFVPALACLSVDSAQNTALSRALSVTRSPTMLPTRPSCVVSFSKGGTVFRVCSRGTVWMR